MNHIADMCLSTSPESNLQSLHDVEYEAHDCLKTTVTTALALQVSVIKQTGIHSTCKIRCFNLVTFRKANTEQRRMSSFFAVYSQKFCTAPATIITQ